MAFDEPGKKRSPRKLDTISIAGWKDAALGPECVDPASPDKHHPSPPRHVFDAVPHCVWNQEPGPSSQRRIAPDLAGRAAPMTCHEEGENCQQPCRSVHYSG